MKHIIHLSIILFISVSMAQTIADADKKITPVINYVLLDDNNEPPIVSGNNECNDGIDNDGDGLIDWQFDFGCWGAGDNTEVAATRQQENGWTTFNPSDDS